MKIFLSSTYEDLKDHRASVAQALARFGQRDLKMEDFGARPSEPRAASLREIDNCDLFVGVYGYRYGYIPEGDEISITESEFQHARKRDKPLFCFVVADGYQLPEVASEDGIAKEKLTRLKKEILRSVVTETFTTPEDLSARVVLSIELYLREQSSAEPHLPTWLTSPLTFNSLGVLLVLGIFYLLSNNAGLKTWGYSVAVGLYAAGSGIALSAWRWPAWRWRPRTISYVMTVVGLLWLVFVAVLDIKHLLPD